MWTDDWGSGGPYCSALACPRIRNIGLDDRVPAGELGADSQGNQWCNHCWRQLELMNWGEMYHWPPVRVQGRLVYAIYQGASSWFLSIVGANLDMVSALHETLIEGKRESLPINWPA